MRVLFESAPEVTERINTGIREKVFTCVTGMVGGLLVLFVIISLNKREIRVKQISLWK